MKYFDTHTHTNYEPLSSELSDIVSELKSLEMGINIVGCDKNSSQLAVEQAQQYDHLFCSIGIHPEDAINHQNMMEIKEFLVNLYHQSPEKILCIGECGLDYYYCQDEKVKSQQKLVFQTQILVAHELGLPVMMHIRDAHDDAIEIIKQNLHLNLTWIVHCFSGNATEVQKYIDLNCYISIPGIITFKNANYLREAIKIIPLNLLLTETDAPFLTPVPFRGKTNYPQYLVHTNKFISEILQINLETLNKQLLSNAFKALNINAKI